MGVKHITADHGRAFFHPSDDGVLSDLARKVGCYILAIRSKGMRAAYVGAATKSFAKEVFTPDKLQKYNTALHQHTHGSPVLLFVTMPGRNRSKALTLDVEEYLIRSAKRAWPELLNKHHAGPDDWDISRVTGVQKGKPSGAERSLKKLLRFE